MFSATHVFLSCKKTLKMSHAAKARKGVSLTRLESSTPLDPVTTSPVFVATHHLRSAGVRWSGRASDGPEGVDLIDLCKV